MTDYKKELEDFAYIISHDLNAPFRHIREFGNILVRRLKDKISPEEKEYLQYMEEGIFMAEDMLAALLEYSRLTTLEQPYATFDCNDVMKDVLFLLKPKIDESKAEITTSNLPETLSADKNQITKLFSYLLDNAVKFHKNGVTPKINVSAEQKDDNWIFRIEDKGIGVPIAEKDMAFIFFKRLYNAKDFPGIGAGLTLAKKIVARHEGEIWIEDSGTDNGTTVCFKFPS